MSRKGKCLELGYSPSTEQDPESGYNMIKELDSSSSPQKYHHSTLRERVDRLLLHLFFIFNIHICIRPNVLLIS